MAETHRQKQQITAALTEVRIQVQNEILHLRHSLNLKQHVLESIKKYPWEWTSCAAIFGWLLAGLPARKQRIYIHSSGKKRAKSRLDRPLAKLWKEVWKISKRLMAAYIAESITVQSKEPESS
jgi:hypothetical protein